MSQDNNHIKQYTASDIQRYLNGQMSASEKHALEKAALEDAFLAEAIEGYQEAALPSVKSDIAELKQRLHKKGEIAIVPLHPVRRLWWTVAAAVLLIAGAGTTWYLFNQSPQTDIAQKLNEVKPPAPNPADTPTSSRDNKAEEVAPEVRASAPQEAKREKPVAISADKSVTQKDSISDLPGNQSAGAVAAPQPAAESRKLSSPVKREADENAEPNKRDMAVTAAQAKTIQRGKENDNYISSHIFKGRVTSSENQPLPFVNISADGVHAYTDAQGNFTILSGDTTLNASVKSVGYEPKKVMLSSGISLNNITLSPGSKDLSEVVVTGYGMRKAKSMDKKGIREEEEALAAPVDGWGNYDIYLSNNKRLPSENNNITGGFVEVSFTVNKAGFLYNFNIEKSTCTACNREAIRLIKEGPKWKLTDEKEQSGKMTITLQF